MAYLIDISDIKIIKKPNEKINNLYLLKFFFALDCRINKELEIPINGKKYLFISIFDLHIKLSYNFSLIYKVSFFDSDSLNDKEIFSNATFNT